MMTINDNELLYLIAQNDREAEEMMLKKYELLIWKNVNVIVSQYVPQGVERDDLFQEGMIALRKALTAFDTSLNVPFFAFANLCIRRSMIGYIRKFNTKASKQFYESVSLDASIAENTGMYYSDVISDETDVSALVKYDEKLGQVYLQCPHMNEFEKDVLVLQVAGYSYAETADLLKCSAKKVDNTMQKIKRLLI